MSPLSLPPPEHRRSRTIDPTKVRLSVLAILVVSAFVAMFSRLWYLQVLAVDELRAVAKDNRIRTLHSEPPRGRILANGGQLLVDNTRALAVSLESELLDNPYKKNVVLVRLARVLNVGLFDMYERLKDRTVSPYKPIPVAFDVSEDKVNYIEEHGERFPGVVIEQVWRREVVRGDLAPHILGFTGEISADELKDKEWRGYELGDIIGKAGVERSFDRHLRGQPRVERLVVDSAGDPIGAPHEVRDERPGADVVLTIRPRIQEIVQSSLASGVLGARGENAAPNGAAVVMDPRTGNILAMASYPTYNAKMLADGISEREFKRLNGKTPKYPEDDALTNRPLTAALPPGSTFKVITSAAALSLGIAAPGDYLPCPAQIQLPPGPGGYLFPNDVGEQGSISFSRALEISCNTFFFNLGWKLEEKFGPNFGDGTLQFQRYAHSMSFGRETGIELPYEDDGIVPDPLNCKERGSCPGGQWLPGYTINMAVGQGDLLATPLQMATAFSAIANGGNVLQPHIVKELARHDVTGKPETVKEFGPVVVKDLELSPEALYVIEQGMIAVTQGGNGTANDAFVGFPYTVAGKTGTAQVGANELDQSHAWFVSYAPAEDPRYVVAVYVNLGGIGGETAAPIAREIYEGIFQNDRDTSVDIQSGGGYD